MRGYEGVTAYAFVKGLTRDGFGRLFTLPRSPGSNVHSAARLIGAHDAMLCIQASTLEDVDETLMGLDLDPCLVIEVVVAMLTILPPGGVTWRATTRTTAFVQVRTAIGKAEDVLDAARELPGVVGIALVSGNFDILLEIEGDSIDDVGVHVMNELHQIDGIVRTHTSFATTIVTDQSQHPIQT